SSFLPVSQWAVIGNDDVKISLKGGNNGEPHNHNDIGSFSILKNGEMILCDIGSGEYTKEYFSDKRYEILCDSSFGHSVPIINGYGQSSGSEFTQKTFFPKKHL
ncbi:MAG: heparinase II/III family protein, partial [Clostridia bacterium]|nr:heparinase II/III family protein [Clostridia bacterium]